MGSRVFARDDGKHVPMLHQLALSRSIAMSGLRDVADVQQHTTRIAS